MGLGGLEVRGFLLDTNVVSEVVRPAPDLQVVAFMNSGLDLWLSAIVIHELDFGLELMQPGLRRRQMGRYLSAIQTEHETRLIAVGGREATHAARLRARARRSGRTATATDALIAGTAAVHDLVVATRDVADFRALGVDVVSPWEPL